MSTAAPQPPAVPAQVFAWAHRSLHKDSDGWRFTMRRPDVMDEAAWEIVALAVLTSQPPATPEGTPT